MKIIKIVILGSLLLLSATARSGHVNINNADAQTLAVELKGIGIKKANAIVEYRELNGAFKSINDLVNVKGISDKTLEKNKENILLGKK